MYLTQNVNTTYLLTGLFDTFGHNVQKLRACYQDFKPISSMCMCNQSDCKLANSQALITLRNRRQRKIFYVTRKALEKSTVEFVIKRIHFFWTKALVLFYPFPGQKYIQLTYCNESRQ